MSFYTLAEASLTTIADCRRRPFVDKGQIVRVLVLSAMVLVALVVRLHHG